MSLILINLEIWKNKKIPDDFDKKRKISDMFIILQGNNLYLTWWYQMDVFIRLVFSIFNLWSQIEANMTHFGNFEFAH